MRRKVFFLYPILSKKSDKIDKYSGLCHQSGTPNAVKFNIFKRINKIGKQRNREELRNIFFQDSVSKRIAKLAESSEFLQATHKMISQKGMADRELVCRYFAFRLLLRSLVRQKIWMIS